MEIVGKIEVKGFLRCRDLDDGDVFTFLDSYVPYMVVFNECDTYIINLRNGYIEEGDDSIEERPVRRLKAKLIIED